MTQKPSGGSKRLMDSIISKGGGTTPPSLRETATIRSIFQRFALLVLVTTLDAISTKIIMFHFALRTAFLAEYSCSFISPEANLPLRISSAESSCLSLFHENKDLIMLTAR